MARAKILFGVTLLIAVLLAAAGPSHAQNGEWQSLTSFKDVRRMIEIDDTLWAATSGGLLAVVDPNLPGRQLTNVDGLGTPDLTDMIVDNDGVKWISAAGRLIRIDGGIETFPTFPRDLRLLSVVDDGDRLWLGSDSGLILFSKVNVGGQFEDRYSITLVNSFPRVSDVLLEDTLIWLATGNGLAYADRRNPALLKSPANWTVLNTTTNPELNASDIRRIAHYENTIYLTTESGFFRLNAGPTDTTFTDILSGGGIVFADMRVDNDSLFLYYSSALAYIENATINVIPAAGTPTTPVTGYNNGSYRWFVARNSLGIFENSGGGQYEEYRFTGTPGNKVSDVAVHANGTIAAGFDTKRAAILADGTWNVWEYAPAFRSTKLLADDQQNTWIGTEGGGLWRADDATLRNYNDTNSTIVGNNDAPPGSFLFAIIRDVLRRGDILYTALFKAYTGEPVAFARLGVTGLPVEWDALGPNDGMTNIDLSSLAHKPGILAVGSLTAGLFWCRVGSDPFSRQPDICDNLNSDTTFLVSDVVQALDFSPDGELWIGTNFGISRLDESRGLIGQVGLFVDVELPLGFGPDVRALTFDPQGNVWIGSTNGLALLETRTGNFEIFTTDNSGLISDTVTSITVDDVGGDIWIGTPSGISRLAARLGRLTSEIDSVVAFPNPFIIDSPEDEVRFNLAGQHSVQIFSVSGELVWEEPTLSDPRWNGRNMSDKEVASGVYLFVLKDSDGNVTRGKILLVRQ